MKVGLAPQFFIHKEEDFRKANDTEGRASEPLEWGHD